MFQESRILILVGVLREKFQESRIFNALVGVLRKKFQERFHFEKQGYNELSTRCYNLYKHHQKQ